MSTFSIVIASCFIVFAASGAEMSKDQCAPIVEGTKANADQLGRTDVAFAKLETKQKPDLTSDEIFESV